ncbi:MAG: CRISPR-associated ring nuclease Csm6 [Pseudomonadota bacterium]
MKSAHRLLVAVAGSTPQVLTETLYALAKRPERPFVPDALKVFTTSEGGAQLARALLAENQLARLCSTLGLPTGRIAFAQSDIEIFRGAGGAALEDLRNPADNIAAADHLVRRLAELTADPDCTVHASLAGGRKTMSFYLGHAMSLFGRVRDELSHVLVNEPFEAHPDFYFPPEPPVALALRDGRQVSTADARIQLVDVPFLRLGDLLDAEARKLLQADSFSFAKTVDWAQIALDEPAIRIELTGPDCDAAPGGGRIVLGTRRPVTLVPPPRELAFYLWFAQARRQGCEDPAVIHRQKLDWPRYAANAKRHHIELKLPAKPEPDYFDQCLHAVKTAIGQAAGPYALKHYQISSPKRRSGLYGLHGLPPEAITITSEATSL